ncbi:MAG: DegV family protein [Stomatobaculum sp.]|nr:DegV family protein [Stomatobaculum sp.]
MSTAVVTDTNSGIYEEEGKKLGVRVVPMPVLVNEETHYEGRGFTLDQLFSEMEKGSSVTTSQPSPADLTEIWDSVLKEYDDLVYIPMSSGISGSMQTAAVLSQDYEGKVQVADNHRISVTQRHSVMDALNMAAQGMNAAQIKNLLEQTGRESVVYLGVETLEYLKRSGRVSGAAAAIGSILHIKPILVCRGDKFEPFATVRGTKNCRKKITEALQKEAVEMQEKGYKIRVACAGSFTDPDEGARWKQQVEEAFPGEKIWYDPLSLSVCAHTGPDAFGIAVSMAYEPASD